VHSRLGSWPVARSAGAVELLVRPEQLIVQPEAGGAWEVVQVRFAGALRLVRVRALAGGLCLWVLTPTPLVPGQRVELDCQREAVVILPAAPAEPDAAAAPPPAGAGRD
jgi:hypothetical protein